MKRGVVILAFLVIITIIGGMITAGLANGVPTIIQTTEPSANVFAATPSQAGYFLALILFIIFNVIGAGLTLALLFWLGSREKAITENMPNRADRIQADALPEGNEQPQLAG